MQYLSKVAEQILHLRGDFVLVAGNYTSKSDLFLKKLLFSALTENWLSFYVSSRQTFSKFTESMKHLNIDITQYLEQGYFYYLDLMSNNIAPREKYQDKVWLCPTGDLSQLGMILLNSLDLGIEIYFGDFLTDLLIKEPLQKVYKFFRRILDEFYKRKVLAIFYLDKSAHSTETFEVLSYLASVVVTTKVDHENNLYFKVETSNYPMSHAWEMLHESFPSIGGIDLNIDIAASFREILRI
jgi:archaellum biogenesis ATPase FlaH